MVSHSFSSLSSVSCRAAGSLLRGRGLEKSGLGASVRSRGTSSKSRILLLFFLSSDMAAVLFLSELLQAEKNGFAQMDLGGMRINTSYCLDRARLSQAMTSNLRTCLGQPRTRHSRLGLCVDCAMLVQTADEIHNLARA